jgi:hypothetical protein
LVLSLAREGSKVWQHNNTNKNNVTLPIDVIFWWVTIWWTRVVFKDPTTCNYSQHVLSPRLVVHETIQIRLLNYQR